MGIPQIVAAIRLHKSAQNEWWMILSGTISALFGTLMTADPGAGALAVVWVTGACMVFFGMLLITPVLRLRKTSALRA